MLHRGVLKPRLLLSRLLPAAVTVAAAGVSTMSHQVSGSDVTAGASPGHQHKPSGTMTAPSYGRLLTELATELSGPHHGGMEDMLPFSAWAGVAGDNRLTYLQPHHFREMQQAGLTSGEAGSSGTAGMGPGGVTQTLGPGGPIGQPLALPFKACPLIRYGGGAWPVHPGARLDQDATRATPMVSWPGEETLPEHPGNPPLTTLLMIDPDAPGPSKPSARSWLHWMVVNVPPRRFSHSGDPTDRGLGKAADVVCDVANGHTVVPYAGPTPPMGTHRYIFLVCHQTGHVTVGGTGGSGRVRAPSMGSGGREDRLDSAKLEGDLAQAGRGKFDVPSFLASHGLKVIGLNWYTVAAHGAQ